MAEGGVEEEEVKEEEAVEEVNKEEEMKMTYINFIQFFLPLSGTILGCKPILNINIVWINGLKLYLW